MASSLTLRAMEHKHGLGNSRLNDWLKKYGYKVRKPYIIETRDMTRSMAQKDPDKNSRVQELEKQLEMARLEATAYRKMIEIAEEELKIEIRKKLDTKQ